MTSPGGAYGVWARYCHPCQTVTVCRSSAEIVKHATDHPGHYCALAGGTDVVTAGDLAALLPEPFRSIYWDTKVDEYLSASGDPRSSAHADERAPEDP